MSALWVLCFLLQFVGTIVISLSFYWLLFIQVCLRLLNSSFSMNLLILLLCRWQLDHKHNVCKVMTWQYWFLFWQLLLYFQRQHLNNSTLWLVLRHLPIHPLQSRFSQTRNPWWLRVLYRSFQTLIILLPWLTIWKFQNLEVSNLSHTSGLSHHNLLSSWVSILEEDCQETSLMEKTTQAMLDMDQLFTNNRWLFELRASLLTEPIRWSQCPVLSDEARVQVMLNIT